MNPAKAWLSVLTGILLFPGGAIWAEGETRAGAAGFEKPPAEMIFSFLQVFPEAHAVRRKENVTSEGRWTGDRFQFQEALAAADIYIESRLVVNGSTREAIAFQIEPGFDSTLIFSGVPPGRKLQLFVAIPDVMFIKEKVVPVEFQAWVGKKKILGLQVSTKGWKQESIDLSLPFLLQRSYQLTFTVRTADKEARKLLLYGYIE